MNTEIKYLELLSKTFKNIAETSTEIINLQAIMNLPIRVPTAILAVAQSYLKLKK